LENSGPRQDDGSFAWFDLEGVAMKEAAPRDKAGKKRYKVVMAKAGDRKVRYVDYVWAGSAREAKRIVLEKNTKTGANIRKIRAGATG
jgi:hypothetical protein